MPRYFPFAAAQRAAAACHADAAAPARGRRCRHDADDAYAPRHATRVYATLRDATYS